MEKKTSKKCIFYWHISKDETGMSSREFLYHPLVVIREVRQKWNNLIKAAHIFLMVFHFVKVPSHMSPDPHPAGEGAIISQLRKWGLGQGQRWYE